MAKKESLQEEGPRIPMAEFLGSISQPEVRSGFGASVAHLSSTLLTADAWRAKLSDWLQSPA